MKIALIYPPFHHKIFSENLKVVDEEFCLAPPIILAYVAAILERAGHRVKLIDANALGLSMDETLKILEDFRPDFLGVRLETYHFHQTLNWIRYLKRHLKVPVIAGGINLSLYPKETLSHFEIDYGIIGEATDSLPLLVSALENGKDFSNIKGVAHRNNGKVIINPPQDKLVNLDSYPFPARHLLPNDKYYSFISQRKNFTIMVTTTGCPFKCIFCAISKIPYRERTPRNVVDEIEHCYRDYSIREIDLFDATLFINKDRVKEICREIRRRKIKIEWSCRSRVDLVDSELLREVSLAGCRQIYYGIESSDPQILQAINKKTDLEKIKNAIKLSKNFGIRTMGFFMIGNPGDTKETVNDTIKFAKDLGLDFIQVCRTIAKPNTELHERLKEETSVDYWRDYILGKAGEERLPSPWTELSQKEIERLTKRAYLSFYFRPLYVLKVILMIKSLAELVRYIKVAFKMLRLKYIQRE